MLPLRRQQIFAFYPVHWTS